MCKKNHVLRGYVEMMLSFSASNSTANDSCPMWLVASIWLRMLFEDCFCDSMTFHGCPCITKPTARVLSGTLVLC